MNDNKSKGACILAISPAASGLGFAVMKDKEAIIDSATRWIGPGDKNAQSLAKIEKLIARFQPETLVLPDVFKKESPAEGANMPISFG